MKESLSLAISELQIEKSGKATIDDITQEWANNTLNVYSPILESDENIKIITMQKDEVIKRYKINLDLSIEELQSGRIKVTYEVGEKTGNNIKILIKVTAEDGIKEVHTPNTDVIHANGKSEVAIDYIVELNVDYKFTIISETGEEKEEIIHIYSPKINYPKEECLALNVDVEYPKMDITNARKEYSLDGINYFIYENPVEVKKNCTFYARIINAETNEIIVQNQEAIENILYQWETWEAVEKFRYEQKTQENYEYFMHVSTETTTAYTSWEWTESGAKVVGSTIKCTVREMVGKYCPTYAGVLEIKHATTGFNYVGSAGWWLTGTQYYKEKISLGFSKGNKLEDVSNKELNAFPEDGVKDGIWYKLK